MRGKLSKLLEECVTPFLEVKIPHFEYVEVVVVKCFIIVLMLAKCAA